MKNKLIVINTTVIISTVLFFCCLFWFAIGFSSSFSESEISKITTEELVKLNAKDFIQKIKQYRILEVFYTNTLSPNDSVPRDDIGIFLAGWPSKEDIPYLLSVVDDESSCGVIGYPFKSISPRRMGTYSQVGTVSVSLLKAIKEGKFYILDWWPELSPKERQEIIAWATMQEN